MQNRCKNIVKKKKIYCLEHLEGGGKHRITEIVLFKDFSANEQQRFRKTGEKSLRVNPINKEIYIIYQSTNEKSRSTKSRCDPSLEPCPIRQIVVNRVKNSPVSPV